MTKQYFRRELDGHLVWSDFEMEANQYVAEKYTRITRAKWREYKRVQREAQVQRNMDKVIEEHAQESALHGLVKETEAERMMSEEPYL